MMTFHSVCHPIVRSASDVLPLPLNRPYSPFTFSHVRKCSYSAIADYIDEIKQWLRFSFDGSPTTSTMIVTSVLADIEAKLVKYNLEKRRRKAKKKYESKSKLDLSRSHSPPTPRGGDLDSPREGLLFPLLSFFYNCLFCPRV